MARGDEDAADPSDYLYRAVIVDCRITVAQLATAFRIDDRRLVSAGHPFEDIQSFTLTNVKGEIVQAELVHLVPGKDLAVLELVEPVSGGAVQLANEEVAAQTAVSIPTFNSDGFLEINDAFAVRRAQVTLNGENERRSVELEGVIGPGDSGAPILHDGDVVGVVFASTRGAETGWAVALPEIEGALANAGTEALPLTCPEDD
ncbi:MAG: trypsin-like peptidase domain-containing protein [Acidimicrobiales bacterium]|nr:trypsin-like peptidase domain-containing protein [Acidimicrobiales bacterium]